MTSKNHNCFMNMTLFTVQFFHFRYFYTNFRYALENLPTTLPSKFFPPTKLTPISLLVIMVLSISVKSFPVSINSDIQGLNEDHRKVLKKHFFNLIRSQIIQMCFLLNNKGQAKIYNIFDNNKILVKTTESLLQPYSRSNLVQGLNFRLC